MRRRAQASWFHCDLNEQIARGTALRGAFDSDVVVAWPGPKRTACQAIARRLDVEGSAFKVDHIGQQLVRVLYRGELKVEIVLQQHIEARGGPYAHVRNFEQAREAHNHLVRILQGWARLRCRALGYCLKSLLGRRVVAVRRRGVISSRRCSCSGIISRGSIRQIRTTTV